MYEHHNDPAYMYYRDDWTDRVPSHKDGRHARRAHHQAHGHVGLRSDDHAMNGQNIARENEVNQKDH